MAETTGTRGSQIKAIDLHGTDAKIQTSDGTGVEGHLAVFDSTGGLTDGGPVSAGTEVEEIPAGTRNGTNTVFTLAGTPKSGAPFSLYLNGVLQRPTFDYAISANTIYYAWPLKADDWHICYYVPTGGDTGGGTGGGITLTSVLPLGEAGTAYSQTLTATGGTGPYTFAVSSGSLPDGITLSSSGVLSGTATTAGTSTFTVTATDSHGATGSQVISMIVAEAGGGSDLAAQIYNDMTGSNEAHPHGVPSSYDFYSGPIIGTGNYIVPNTALEWWGDVYVGPSGNPASNTKVAIKNVQLWWLRASNGAWVEGVAPTSSFDGGYYSEDFATDFGTSVPMRTEGDGSVSITTTAGNVAHIFTPYPRVPVDNSDIAGVVALAEAKLVLDNPAGTDDRASAKFLLSVGADPYPGTTGAGIENNTAVGGGKFKWVTTDWRSFAMTTMSLAELESNPPPIDLTGILS